MASISCIEGGLKTIFNIEQRISTLEITSMEPFLLINIPTIHQFEHFFYSPTILYSTFNPIIILEQQDRFGGHLLARRMLYKPHVLTVKTIDDCLPYKKNRIIELFDANLISKLNAGRDNVIIVDSLPSNFDIRHCTVIKPSILFPLFLQRQLSAHINSFSILHALFEETKDLWLEPPSTLFDFSWHHTRIEPFTVRDYKENLEEEGSGSEDEESEDEDM